MEEKNIIALEIGSSKIKAALGTLDPNGALTVRAVEEEKLVDCVSYGCIRNVAEVARVTSEIMARIEARESPRRIEGVYVGLGGRSVTSTVTDIERRLPSPMEISAEIVSDMQHDALERPMRDRRVIDATPREYRVDGSPTSKLEGNYGSLVTAKLNVISCRDQLIRNLMVVLDDRLQLKLHGVFSRQLAQADLVLQDNERRLGCVLVDFGAETTGVSIYKGGVLRHLVTLPMGSRNITRDITALKHLDERAEELKILYGNAMGNTPGDVHAAVSQEMADINNYVGARAGEIIANINEQIKSAGYSADSLPGGVILVGGGALLQGFSRRLADVTGMKVRSGLPASHIRIGDGRIQQFEAVDVISILAAAARQNPQECMTRPQPVFEQPLYQRPEQRQPAAAQPATATQEEHRAQQQPTRPVAPEFPNRTIQQPAAKVQDLHKTTKQEPQKPKGPSLGKRMGTGIRNFFTNIMTEPDDEQ